MKLVDDKLQERLLDYLATQISFGDGEAQQLYLLLQRKRKKVPYHHGGKESHESVIEDAYKEHTGQI